MIKQFFLVLALFSFGCMYGGVIPSGDLLLQAARYGDLKEAQRALKKGAFIDVQDNKHMAPLTIAAAMGHTDIVNYLLSQGANVNIKDDTGMTPLMYAVEIGFSLSPDLVDVLLHTPKLDVNAKDETGKTALMHAARIKDAEKIVKDLIQAAVDINLKDNEGATALDIARSYKNKPVMEVLQEAKAHKG